MILIGIAGKKASGKDEVCNFIRARLPNTQRIAFADALKDEVCRAMLVTREYLDAHKSHFRLILQGWGTDYRRQMHGEDYWLRQWLKRVRQNESTESTIVVPDVRFTNEARFIHELNGLLFHVKRPSLNASDDHLSENDLDQFTEFDRYILNNGSLKQLQVEVDVALDMCHLLTPNIPTQHDNCTTDDITSTNDSTATVRPVRTERL